MAPRKVGRNTTTTRCRGTAAKNNAVVGGHPRQPTQPNIRSPICTRSSGRSRPRGRSRGRSRPSRGVPRPFPVIHTTDETNSMEINPPPADIALSPAIPSEAELPMTPQHGSPDTISIHSDFIYDTGVLISDPGSRWDTPPHHNRESHSTFHRQPMASWNTSHHNRLRSWPQYHDFNAAGPSRTNTIPYSQAERHHEDTGEMILNQRHYHLRQYGQSLLQPAYYDLEEKNDFTRRSAPFPDSYVRESPHNPSSSAEGLRSSSAEGLLQTSHGNTIRYDGDGPSSRSQAEKRPHLLDNGPNSRCTWNPSASTLMEHWTETTHDLICTSLAPSTWKSYC
ncbi:uncharacterized protein LOC115088132 isoform X2 [Rhinatrema bivittatum]|uniref:uncharacterized protein LOC115088132 isoform X2 n=1 Tax=Rhinatrema bivittatum TaxID=194408 RepID=UPI0011285650|nr:uncharacterized protein LOC115088132 isoform X2 [Rhinatrema bivittatum]